MQKTIMNFRSVMKVNIRLFQYANARHGLIQYCKAVSKENNTEIPKENQADINHDTINNRITMSLRYINDELRVNKVFYFNRDASEISSLLLTKISEKINFHVNKKREQKFPDLSDINVSVQLVSKSEELLTNLDSISCAESFVNSNNYLKIGNNEYSLNINPPVLTSLQLPKKCILAGFMVYPAKVEGLNCDSMQIKWFCSKDTFCSFEEAMKKNLKELHWKPIGEGFSIFISKDDKFKLLKVIGTPMKGELVGESYESIAGDLISSITEIFPFERRHKFTPHILNQDFLRIVSYNLLAEFYAKSEYSRSTLFPYCPAGALCISYRKQLFMKEILGYNADLICLQEVDKKVFYQDLKPIFSLYNLEGSFNSKSGLTAEGLAIFYNTQKFKLKEENCYILSQELENNQIFEDLCKKVQENEALLKAFQKQKAVLKVFVLERKNIQSDALIVGTTHLSASASSDHIRLLQAWMCLCLLKYDRERHRNENPERKVTVLLSGDFNSFPEDAAYRLITSKCVDAEDSAWRSRPEEELKELHLSHDLNLKSACGTPEYTNYTNTFNGCLDYIFYESDILSVEQMVPFPSHEEVTAHGGLPSVTIPSDHLALVADLKWNTK